MGDKRRDSGEYYPGGKVIPRQPVSPGGGADPNAVHYYDETKTDEQKAQARQNIGAMPADTPIPPETRFDSQPTEGSQNAARSGGIWSWVKSLLPSWLTAESEEPRGKTDLDAYEQRIEYGDFTYSSDIDGLVSAIGTTQPEFSYGSWAFTRTFPVGGHTYSVKVTPGTGDELSLTLGVEWEVGPGTVGHLTMTRTMESVKVPVGKLSHVKETGGALPSGLAKLGAGGELTAAKPSSTGGEDADYRDPKDATCHESKLGEWTFGGGSQGVVGLEMVFQRHPVDGPYWYIKLNDEAVTSFMEGEEDATHFVFNQYDKSVFSSAPIATRQRVATKDETFVTPSYVKDVADPYVITDAVYGGVSVKINGETVTMYADLLAKCKTGRAVLYGQATTVETGYAFYTAASVTDSLIQFQVSGMLYDKSNIRYGLYVRRIKIVPRANGGLLVDDSGLEGPFASKDYVKDYVGSDDFAAGLLSKQVAIAKVQDIIADDVTPATDPSLTKTIATIGGKAIKAPEGGGGGSQGYAFVNLTPITESGYKVFAAQDHAINRFTLADATPVKVILPNATDENGRDFILKVNVTSETMPTFEVVKPSDAASVGIEAADDGWADLEAGINYFTITETDRAQ